MTKNRKTEFSKDDGKQQTNSLGVRLDQRDTKRAIIVVISVLTTIVPVVCRCACLCARRQVRRRKDVASRRSRRTERLDVRCPHRLLLSLLLPLLTIALVGADGCAADVEEAVARHEGRRGVRVEEGEEERGARGGEGAREAALCDAADVCGKEPARSEARSDAERAVRPLGRDEVEPESDVERLLAHTHAAHARMVQRGHEPPVQHEHRRHKTHGTAAHKHGCPCC